MTITADFDGQPQVFEIRRNNVPFLEQALGRGLHAVLRDFVNGEWQFADVARIVSFALYGPSKDDADRMHFARQAARFGLPRPAFDYRPHPAVVAVLERDGHGNYAPLAADILSEAVFGAQPEGANVED